MASYLVTLGLGCGQVAILVAVDQAVVGSILTITNCFKHGLKIEIDLSDQVISTESGMLRGRRLLY